MTHADLSTLTHADFRRIMVRARIQQMWREVNGAPPNVEITMPEKDWLFFEALLTGEPPSDGLLDEQAHFLADLAANDIDISLAIHQTLQNVQSPGAVEVLAPINDGLLDQALKMIQSFEWMGRVRGQESYMGARDGALYKACPVCNGLQEEGLEFNADCVGHRPDCRLVRIINGIQDALHPPISSVPTRRNSPRPTRGR